MRRRGRSRMSRFDRVIEIARASSGFAAVSRRLVIPYRRVQRIYRGWLKPQGYRLKVMLGARDVSRRK